MLAIRMQRTGRSGHAQFRVIVQDSRISPTRGRVVSYLGSYNPHTKVAAIDSEKASKYLSNGAQPSDTVARLFKKEGIKLPDWVRISEPKKRSVRSPEKRRSTAPAQPQEAQPAVEQAEVASTEQTEPEKPVEENQTPSEKPAEEPAAEEKPDAGATTETSTETPAETDQAS